MTQLVITFISSKYYIMYLFLRRFVRFRLWPGALLISHSVLVTAIVLMMGAKVFHEVWCRCLKQHSVCAPDFHK